MHVCDIAKAHELAIDYLSNSTRSHIFNLGNNKGHSVKEVIQAAQSVTGVKIKIKIMPRRPGDPPVLIADSQDARTILN